MGLLDLPTEILEQILGYAVYHPTRISKVTMALRTVCSMFNLFLISISFSVIRFFVNESWMETFTTSSIPTANERNRMVY